MNDNQSAHNEMKYQRNALLKRQIMAFLLISVGVYGVTGDASACLSTLLGGAAMTAILVLFTTVAQVLFESVTTQPPSDVSVADVGGVKGEHGGSSNQAQKAVEEEGAGSLEEERETLKNVEEHPPEWNLSAKGSLAILLIPLKFFILLIPLFVFRCFGKEGLAYFVVGLLVSIIPTFFRGSRGSTG